MEGEFTLRSTSLQEGQMVPDTFVYNGMGCTGGNLSPQLEWDGAPKGTMSYAITCYDPDAPTDHGWWHWAVINIPPNVTRLEEGASNENRLPAESRELMTDFRKASYGGPCPPQGDRPHRYIFTVYALKEEELPLDSLAKAAAVKDILEENSLGKASFTVKYVRH